MQGRGGRFEVLRAAVCYRVPSLAGAWRMLMIYSFPCIAYYVERSPFNTPRLAGRTGEVASGSTILVAVFNYPISQFLCC